MIKIGIVFILIWLGTTFFIVRYIKKLKDDLLGRFSENKKPPEEKDENILEADDKRGVRPFDFIKRFDANHLLIFIEQEHPQVIALVLAHLEPDKASVILQNLPHEMQSEVSRRIATMDRVSPEILREIERVLEKKLSTLSSEGYVAGGVESITEILNHTDRDSKNQIMKELEDEDPELAEEIDRQSNDRKKPYRKFLETLKGKPKPAVPVKFDG
jgi:flagellar motor switch protein FliG